MAHRGGAVRVADRYWWLDRAAQIPAGVGMIECVQEPGETVFTPPGWSVAAT